MMMPRVLSQMRGINLLLQLLMIVIKEIAGSSYQFLIKLIELLLIAG